jgi:hypothetical protein
MTERSKIFSKKIIELFEKKISNWKKKKKIRKKWFLYAKFDVRVIKWYFCEMIWLSRFYDFYVFYERAFFVRSMSHSYFMYFTNAILCSINESFVFYVFYERISLFDQWVIRILCILRTHFFVWSMSHSCFTNACLCLINLSFVFYERVFLFDQFVIRKFARSSICRSHISLVINFSNSFISGLRWSID